MRQPRRSRTLGTPRLRCSSRRHERSRRCDYAVASTIRELGRLDILINMALALRGEAVRSTSAPRTGIGRCPSICARRSCSRMPRRRRCRSAAAAASSTSPTGWSASARPRYSGYLPYYVAKAGVKALTEALALELAPRSNPRQRDRAGTDPRAAGHVDRRKATPSSRARRSAAGAAKSEIAKAVMFLVESDFVTGETIPRGWRKAREVMAASMWDPSLRASFGRAREETESARRNPAWGSSAPADARAPERQLPDVHRRAEGEVEELRRCATRRSSS